MADPELKKQWLSRECQWRCGGFRRPSRPVAIAASVAALLLVLGVVLGTSIGLTRSKHRSSSSSAISFDENYNISWSADHIRLLNGGTEAQIILDKQSGGEFGSKKTYLFGHIQMRMKLVANDSAGTVTAFYMASHTENRDEFDFEFLGNRSGQPYALQTNVYVNGTGGREQRLVLWFDPSLEFHTYSILWNQYQVIFYVDDTPVRIFRNNSHLGVPYAFGQPMRVFGSMWSGEEWATRGGLEKTNWSVAPFMAGFSGFGIDGCSGQVGRCQAGENWWDGEKYRVVAIDQLDRLAELNRNYSSYDYCTDTKRYSPVPPECGANP